MSNKPGACAPLREYFGGIWHYHDHRVVEYKVPSIGSYGHWSDFKTHRVPLDPHNPKTCK